MKKILYLHAGAEMYGADKVMFDLICNLDRGKYEPYVILPTNGILVDELKKIGVRVEVIPYPILRRKYFNLKGVFKYLIDFFKYSKALVKKMKKEKINIIHNNTSAVLEGAYLSKKLGVPVIWVIHEIIVSPKFVYKLISKIISKYSTTTITVSNAVKEHLEKTGYFKDKNIVVIHNGVDTNRFNSKNNCDYLRQEWNIPKKTNVIGMLARVNSIKGQHDLLKAANIVMKKHHDLYTVFIGDAFEGEEWREKELLDAINQSPYKDRIIFQRFRKDSEYIHALFDVYVLPSIKPDSFPTVVLEAMASGKAVVGYKCGGICEMVEDGHNGYLIDVYDYESLANKIDLLLKNKTLLKRMGKNSQQKLLQNFSLQSYVDKFSIEYDRFLNKK